MSTITRPSVTRLARRAGVKSMGDDCFETTKRLIDEKLTEVLRVALIVNSEGTTKTLMAENIYDALNLMGENVTHSSELGTSTCNK